MSEAMNSPKTAFAVAFAVSCSIAVAACGGDPASLGSSGNGSTAGFPTSATKNTTRVGGSNPTEDAAAVALAVWPGGGQRPRSVTLLPGNWQSAIAATPLIAEPFRSALLFAPDGDVPDVTQSTLDRLNPTGVRSAAGVKRIRIDDAGDPGNTQQIAAQDPASLADAVDRSRLGGGARLGNSVVVVGENDAAWAMPAAGWAARSGDPVLFTQQSAVPAPTVAAIKRRGRPLIMLLAPTSEASLSVEKQLGRLGTVRRITAANPLLASIEFARFRDGDAGWGVVDPGHGLVIASQSRPLDAAASAALSGSGSYGPMLVAPKADDLPIQLAQYLLDIQPGYRGDPSRGLYNHGWLIGDTDTFSEEQQAKLDALLEISQAKELTTQ